MNRTMFFQMFTPKRLVNVCGGSLFYLGRRSRGRIFRSNQGVVSNSVRTLPADLADSKYLRWRKELLPGHLTLIIIGQRLFVTGFDPDTRSLYTLAMNKETSDEIWRRKAPAQRIESFHRVESPAAATIASDGERLFSFFGSYWVALLRSGEQSVLEAVNGPISR
ncbi:MAG: hypothetical protein M2R45_01708 [Verrucomicrobia subdivision 3 bacterium]|nr:hypothetical protein [Limisphaerales bacterium]MCS1413447.1 hypothetical protein [Limisphaerales bacterium]